MTKTNLDTPFYKRLLDLSILAGAHLLLAPLWILIWAGIATAILVIDGRPIFHAQTRVGKGNKKFRILKFRTMVADQENNGNPWTVDGDPRITRFGGILRRTALDELPQILSILKGDMSFVGPKPLMVEEHELLCERIPDFEGRLVVLPGLTGLAQVYDKNDDAETKLKYDLEYTRRQGLFLDLRLILKSILFTVTGRWDKRSGKSPLQY